jgi:hypothetical protein
MMETDCLQNVILLLTTYVAVCPWRFYQTVSSYHICFYVLYTVIYYDAQWQVVSFYRSEPMPVNIILHNNARKFCYINILRIFIMYSFLLNVLNGVRVH